MTTLASDINEQTVPWPEQPCTPWCTSGKHDGEHPVDRSCWSRFGYLHLSRRPPIEMGDQNWAVDWLDLCLRRRPSERTGVLLINDETNRLEIELTLDEARLLVAHVTALLALEP